MMRIFRVAKSGNVQKLEVLLRGVALKCAGFDGPLTPSVRPYAAAAFNISKYRAALGNVLLSSKDWFDKTLLHIAVDGRSIPCIDVVLQFAQEARVKDELLDAMDAFGQTPLYLAIRRRCVEVTKKLIAEGSDLFVMNNVGQTPLGLILQRLPAITSFLLDGAITVSGEISSDSLFLNIDFGILTAPVDINKDLTTEIHFVKFLNSIPQNENDIDKVALNLESEDEEVSPMVNSPKQPQPQVQILVNGKSSIKNTNNDEFLTNREMTVLGQMVNSGHKRCLDILSHPVTQTFLDLKWRRMKYLLWATYTGLRIGVYGLYILLMYRVYFHHCPLYRKRDEDKQCGWSQWTQGLLPVVLVFNLAFLFHELVKAADVKKMKDFKRYLLIDPGPKVFIRALFLAIVVGTCVPPFLDGTLDCYQYALATLGILICAGLILQVVGNSNCDFGIHSIYVHVYGKVMLRFFSVIATFSPLIISFSLAFNIMYPQHIQFSTFFRSLFRLVMMLQGEFDFEDKFYNENERHGDADDTDVNHVVKNTTSHLSRNDEQLIFWSGQILFGLLGCVLTLVLIDVFLGYTVSDINELKKQAEFVRRCNQVSQMQEAERFISLAVGFLEYFGISSASFVDHFNVIPTKRRKEYRTDMVVSFEEFNESLQAQFREILMDHS